MKNIKIEVNPKIELAQVILFLADRQDKTCQCLNNQYYTDKIRKYFSSFSGHPIVFQTQRLIDTECFIHIGPLRAVLALDNLLSDENNKLHEWSIAVKDFMGKTDFDAFFESNTDYYNMILDKIKSYDVESCIGYTERFFRKTFNNFNLIICPIAGNYGFLLDVPEKNTAYTVRCEPSYSDDEQIIWHEDYFIKGVAHEFAHCFVNPVVEFHKDKLNSISPFFRKHTNMLSVYNVDYAVMNEYWVRAYTDLFMIKLADRFPDFDIQKDLQRQRENFINLDDFIGYIEEYENQSLSFEEFYLNTLKRLE